MANQENNEMCKATCIPGVGRHPNCRICDEPNILSKEHLDDLRKREHCTGGLFGCGIHGPVYDARCAFLHDSTWMTIQEPKQKKHYEYLRGISEIDCYSCDGVVYPRCMKRHKDRYMKIEQCWFGDNCHSFKDKKFNCLYGHDFCEKH